MKELEFPFDGSYLLKKKKSIKRILLSQETEWLRLKIAVLCGSTIVDIKDLLELFLLNTGIKAEFYESGYDKYWEEVMFENHALDDFKPDIIFIHTGIRNILCFPELSDSQEVVLNKLEEEYKRFEALWNRIEERYHCIIIQNNFERPLEQLMGNQDICDYRGKSNYANRLNQKFYEYAWEHPQFYIHDIEGISARYGLNAWQKPRYWYLYKYAMSRNSIPLLSYNLFVIIKALLGKNKKAVILDGDNTLWGGIAAEEGMDAIGLGSDSSAGQAFDEWQRYLLELKQMGILLAIVSKNEKETVREALRHTDSRLREDDFVYIKANWEDKSKNIREIAETLNIGLDQIVFMDDNPVERELVEYQLPDVTVIGEAKAEKFIQAVRDTGWFEMVGITDEDLKRNDMYGANRKRMNFRQEFLNYSDYLHSLQMKAHIQSFEALYCERITQLINKTNQFNLTTKRFTYEQVYEFMNRPEYICLYGRLEDRFGDHGIVSVLVAQECGNVAHIRLFVLSCRVFKREMEYAMLDALAGICQQKTIQCLMGYYYPTVKNRIVKDFYGKAGFKRTTEDKKGNSTWILEMEDYIKKNQAIEMIGVDK